ASMAAAPFPVDLGAPAFGASMTAAAMALVGFERGGLVPFTGPALVHRGEMVLPAHITSKLLHEPSGHGGPNVNLHYAPSINTLSATGMNDALSQHGDLMFASFLKKM